MTGEPSTDDLMAGWQPLGESTSARLRSAERERDEAVRRCADLEQVREELRQKSLLVEGYLADCQEWSGEKAELIDAKLELRAERDAALADRDAVSLIADMLRAELTGVRQELGFSRQAEDDLRAQLERELQRRAWVHEALTSVTVENQRLQAVLNQAIVRFAGEVQRLHGLLDQARAGICGMYVARDDYGLTCLDCDQPIVRGQAVESQPEGAFRHAACPKPTKEN